VNKDILARLGMSSEPKSDTVASRLYAVAVDLDKAGIAAHLSLGGALTRSDALCDAEDDTPRGMRTASCWLGRARWGENGGLWIDLTDRFSTRTEQATGMWWVLPSDDRDAAEELAAVFTAHGFDASCDDAPDDWDRFNVGVRLGGAS
jgi:hypothetical protein